MNFKKMVEERMANTGESWSTAAGHVRAAGKGKAEPPAAPKPFISEPFVHDGSAEPADGGGFFVFDGTSPNAMGPFLDRGGDVGAAEAILEAHVRNRSIADIRIALGQVAKHPLRGSETSFDGITGHGKVADSDGKVEAGVSIWSREDGYHFRLTEVAGGLYSWDELVMSPASFTGFAAAMADLLK